MDGKCGVLHGNLKCGGKWGNCCGVQGICGTGEAFCGLGKCQSGNCTIIIPDPPGAPMASDITTIVSPPPTPGVGRISPDGSCGGASKYQCKGSPFGNCCSSSGFCGSTTGHCNAGCQVDFGECTNPSLSPDGTCGGTNKYQCKDSGFGDCCSANGYCVKTVDHCEAGCQDKFGTCSVINTLPVCSWDPKNMVYICPTATSATPLPTDVSTDGTCGGSKGVKCQGSTFGNCCSKDGYCGSTINHCAQGCQKSFSSACLTANVPTLNGECGASKGGFTCANGPFNGQCCSCSGFCGSKDGHCKTG